MKKLLVVSAICAAIYWVWVIDPNLPGSRFGVVAKVWSTGLLAVMAAVAQPRRNVLVLALAFSVAGDLFLDVRRLGPLGPVQLFMFALVSFLIAHVFYAALFLNKRSEAVSARRKIACGVVVGVAVISLSVLWPGLADMRGPVLAYSLVLTAMAVSAQWSKFGPLVAIGALFFVASDTMLAMNIFGHPFHGARTLVWVTYYLAQAMMAWGVICFSNRAEQSA